MSDTPPTPLATHGLAVRPALNGDAAAMTAILTHYVRTSVVTLDTEDPAPDFFVTKMASIRAFGAPCLVLEHSGDKRVVGYGYGAQYRPNSGYNSSVELSIYLAPDWTGRGVGRPFLDALVQACRAAGFKLAISVITVDPAIGAANMPSGKLHRAAGFTLCDTVPTAAQKFGAFWGIASFVLDLDPTRTAP